MSRQRKKTANGGDSDASRADNVALGISKSIDLMRGYGMLGESEFVVVNLALTSALYHHVADTNDVPVSQESFNRFADEIRESCNKLSLLSPHAITP